ncbi:bifunctional folylpolyglutamate synthase/dihydrofolate synthase [Sedimentibacter sp. zth1]|uniref:bifunctional folylpolyglutamate synthase/dihydrofolate synthase n=1 Tax=Sedimentibacter sp. zth1 TaxID=2816908 RepID=UPI001A935D94|nr:folylpolyglutamate synthase/dihydrofolate synthase family protein [Sedimentibacter sp. zth1]QSX06051.1 bifunctional folylpolyglutamate synthase/dihydrofolate synthase [Sedimentibacter sp. zth1]
MNYEESLKYISDTYKFGSKLGLENIKRLTELLGNPQDKYKIIHVAGTNGKGSTCNMIHNVLVKSGYKVGLFISPFLQEFTERIQINNKQINRDSLAKITTLIKDKIDIMLSEGYNHPTEFEVVTAIGFKYFEEQNIDFLVLEVGLGGRFDATNVVKSSLISVITSISYDHTEYLGDTLEKIAFEKAGIIKENSKVVVYPQGKNVVDVVKEQARKKHSNIYELDSNNIKILDSTIEGQTLNYIDKRIFNLDNFKINMLGEHQAYNCLTVLKVLELLKQEGFIITEKSVKEGLLNSKFAGRFEIIRKKPTIILDGGHNINGVEYFQKAIKRYFKDKKIILFYGMLKDKHPIDVIDYLLDISEQIYTLTPNNPARAMDCKDLRDLIVKRGTKTKVTAIEKYEEILPIIDKIDKDDIIACVGSLYMIGDIRTLLQNNNR